jgi:hypothetical protein
MRGMIMILGTCLIFGLGMASIIILFGWGMAISIIPDDSGSFGKSRALCDRVVAEVLTTRDPVDLRRDIFLIRYLNCSISRRLP